jgi:beta-lactamase class D
MKLFSKRSALLLALFLIPLAATLVRGASAPARDGASPSDVEKPEWRALFESRGAQGSLVIREVAADGSARTFRHDPARCAERFTPASTFKIPNSLIGLDSGVIPDENFVLPWDGQKRWVESWNKDHTLKTAFQVSAYWYYQELARRVGEERMREYVQRLGYGNQDISGGIDQFWLSAGGLRISQEEQIAFLERLYRSELPVSERAQAIVRDIMILETGDGWTLRGKTGLGGRDDRWIGWLVGYLEQGGAVYFYALNIEGPDPGPEFRQKRHEIVRAALKDLGAMSE